MAGLRPSAGPNRKPTCRTRQLQVELRRRPWIEPPPTSEAPPLQAEGGPRVTPAYGPGSPPRDANATRSVHFRRLLRSPWTLSLGLTATIAGFTVATIYLGPALGAAAAAGVLALILAGLFAAADKRAERDFFNAYCGARGLAHVDRGDLPAAVPLLTKGDRRHAEHLMTGTLPGGCNGTLANYTYEVDSTDSEGRRQTAYHHFTVVLTGVPECVPKVAELYCQRRSGARLFDKIEDKFRSKERLRLESEALDRRYEIFAGASEDENWLRQLFSPTFIVWLTEQTAEEFAFELSAGLLCVNVKDHMENAVALDGLCEAAATVAKRLREEALE